MEIPALALIHKELVLMLRKKRTYACLTLFVASFIIACVSSWPENSTLALLGERCRELMVVLSYVMLFGGALFVPALASGSIISEREQNTFDLLMMTLISPGQMLLAKIINSLAFFLILIVAGMPVLGVVFFLVGVDWVQFTEAFVMIFVTMISCAVIGVLSSVLSRNSLAAIFGAYLGACWAIGLFPCLCSFWSPVFMLRSVMGVGGSIGSFPGLLFPFCIGMQLFLTFCIFRLAVRLLRRPEKPSRIDTRKSIIDSKRIRERLFLFPIYLNDPLRRKPSISLKRNPMFVKEFYFDLMSRSGLFYGLVCLAFIPNAFMGMFVALSHGNAEGQVAWYYTQILLTLLVVPAITSNIIPKEFELNNIDTLRMTLLSTRQILWGKLQAAFISILPLLASFFLAGILTVLVSLFYGKPSWILFMQGHAALIVSTLLSLCLTLYVSLFSRRTPMALMLAYLSNLALFVGVFIILWLVALLGLPDALLNMILTVGSMFSPLVAFYQDTSPGYGVSLSFWLLCTAIHLIASVALILASIRKFDRVFVQ